MVLLGIGLVLMPQLSSVAAWATAATTMGAGMALLYPNLTAAVGDMVHQVGGVSFWGSIICGVMAATPCAAYSSAGY